MTHKILCFAALVLTLFFVASGSLAPGLSASGAVETSQSLADRRIASPISTATFGINIWLWMFFGLAAFVSAATLLFLDARGILPRRSARKVVTNSQDDALSVAA